MSFINTSGSPNGPELGNPNSGPIPGWVGPDPTPIPGGLLQTLDVVTVADAGPGPITTNGVGATSAVPAVASAETAAGVAVSATVPATAFAKTTAGVCGVVLVPAVATAKTVAGVASVTSVPAVGGVASAAGIGRDTNTPSIASAQTSAGVVLSATVPAIGAATSGAGVGSGGLPLPTASTSPFVAAGVGSSSIVGSIIDRRREWFAVGHGDFGYGPRNPRYGPKTTQPQRPMPPPTHR